VSDVDDVEDAEETDEFNRRDDDGDEGDGADAGFVAQEVLAYLAENIVDDPDAIEIDAEERRGRIELTLHVAQEDVGKVIGRRGHVVQAIRTLVRAAAARDGLDADVDIAD